MESTEGNKNVSLSLSDDEALVLLQWLFRFNQEEHPSLFEDQAEQRVLWDLEAVLEKVVSVIFSKDYINILSKARENIRAPLD
ncbi:hypothetical protein [Microcoleus sp. herbarium12]|uniref:hypothetical protein n=1 Tax=Microcoleus sp. herbarium12 TaxID=3055437 RepID=UPI002FD6485B